MISYAVARLPWLRRRSPTARLAALNAAGKSRLSYAALASRTAELSWARRAVGAAAAPMRMTRPANRFATTAPVRALDCTTIRAAPGVVQYRDLLRDQALTE